MISEFERKLELFGVEYREKGLEYPNVYIIACPVCKRDIEIKPNPLCHAFCPFCNQRFALSQYQKILRTGSWDVDARQQRAEVIKQIFHKTGVKYKEGKDAFEILCPFCKSRAYYSVITDEYICKCQTIQDASEQLDTRIIAQQYLNFPSLQTAQMIEELLGITSVADFPQEILLVKQYFQEVADTHPAFATIIAFCYYGAILAPYFTFDLGFGLPFEGKWNIGAMIVAPSAVWHKSTMLDKFGDLIKEFIKKNDIPNIKVGEWFASSPEGLVKKISTALDELPDATISFVWLIDEVAHIYSMRADDYLSRNKFLTMRLLDGGDLSRILRGEEFTIEGARKRITFIGATTVEGLQQTIDIQQEIETGFMGRWLVAMPSEEENICRQQEVFRRLKLDTATSKSQKRRMEETRKFINMREDILLTSFILWDKAKHLSVAIELTDDAYDLLKKISDLFVVFRIYNPNISSWLERLIHNIVRLSSLWALLDYLLGRRNKATVIDEYIASVFSFMLQYVIPSYIEVSKKGVLKEFVILRERIENLAKKKKRVRWSELLRALSPFGYKADEVKIAVSDLEQMEKLNVEWEGNRVVVIEWK